jgi:hypothetical protein
MSNLDINNINDLMQALTKLSEKEFEASLLAVAALSMNTIRTRNGKKFLKDFVRGALAENGPMPCLTWQGPAH